MKRFLPAGEIVNTHGIRGEVRVLPWADSPAFLLDFRRFFVDETQMDVVQSRVQKTCVLVKFRGVDSVEEANRLRGKTVYICRDDAKLEDGAVFVDDLLGMTVTDQNGCVLGQIAEVLTLPKNDVYVVKGEREYLIPAVSEFVKHTDVATGQMQVVTIEGMCQDAD